MIHPRNGVGIDVVDLKMRTKAPTFLKKMIQEKTKLENLAEELRVLYVAMTRAKEKLILTGSLKIGEDGLEPYVNLILSLTEFAEELKSMVENM